MDDNPYQPPSKAASGAGSQPKNRLVTALACVTIAALIVAGGLLLLIVLFIVALSFSNM